MKCNYSIPLVFFYNVKFSCNHESNFISISIHTPHPLLIVLPCLILKPFPEIRYNLLVSLYVSQKNVFIKPSSRGSVTDGERADTELEYCSVGSLKH